MTIITKNKIIELIDKQISNTNLYDRDNFNLGYREALRDLKQIIENFEDK